MTAPLTGYADKISVRVGEKIAFKVSSAGPNPYNATLVRIVRGDPNPGGPPPKLEDLAEEFVENCFFMMDSSSSIAEGCTVSRLATR